VARVRLEGSKAEKHETGSEKFNWRAVGETLKDPKSYLTALMFLSCNVAFSSMPVFLPTIIRDMGYSTLASQALSAPPFLLAFVVVLVTASLSDRYQRRSSFLIFHSLVSAAIEQGSFAASSSRIDRRAGDARHNSALTGLPFNANFCPYSPSPATILPARRPGSQDGVHHIRISSIRISSARTQSGPLRPQHP
jgi:hypothetical protein